MQLNALNLVFASAAKCHVAVDLEGICCRVPTMLAFLPIPGAPQTESSDTPVLLSGINVYGAPEAFSITFNEQGKATSFTGGETTANVD